MTPDFVVDLGRDAVRIVLLISAPMLLSGLLIGLLVSIFQAATQINEQTMTFIPKIVVVLVSLIIAAPWIIRIMLSFTRAVFDNILLVGG
ncbi:flagellar biosynthesis protein FliQ [Desulfuromonas thiophila]|jgi:flagellar biosynthetic protein FliQ|uniref:Flagellar biosynthetic protein FliQ n=1 Tax=Desulfuromonas thiophila TaxID=57664 RepID=A0A1G7BJ36_9BACT|nr:flagellar biosynthesis protein FliQ [Desulfuromonas thiophila]MDD3801182.1 flagellar biosynthesis protein FliQ [Desulfuromonas thiophila]MDY0397205.1 flagellar biosynthesis protein FliQ [Desulfuromonas thiophila]SDE26993.1 flagellar biosynthetic protein FliQ [Desulfuromonas thiophila]